MRPTLLVPLVMSVVVCAPIAATAQTFVDPMSVSPSTGNGVTQTFTLQYSDSLGASDLSMARVRFATSVAQGAGTCSASYDANALTIRLMDDAGVWGSPALLGSGTLSNSQCTLNLASSSAAPSGNNLTLVLSVTFTPAFAGAKNIYMFAGGLAPPSPKTGWLLKGTWTVGPALGAVSIAPSSGTGAAQTFSAVFTDSFGVTSDLRVARVRFGASTVSACVFDYNAITNQVRLLDDAGNAPSFGPFSGTLSNSQCSVDLAQSSAAPNGTTLTLDLHLIFKPTLIGVQPVFLRANGNFGVATTGWIARGTWDVNAIVQAISVTPNNGAGSARTFMLAYSDADGVTADLKGARVRLRGASGPQCVVDYNAMTNQVRIQDDVGNWSAFTSFGAGSLSNSQCTLELDQSGAAPSGMNLTLTLRLEFTPAFSGPRTIDMRANSNFGWTTGWIQRGTFTVGFPAVSVKSVSPSVGAGRTHSFTLQYSDTVGAADLAMARVRFGASNVGPGTCTVSFDAGSSTVALLDDAAVSWVPGTWGSGTLANSQCTLNLSSSTATIDGPDLTLVLNITFASSFVGLKNIYMRATDSSGGVTSGWLWKGTWTPNIDPDSRAAVDLGILGGTMSFGYNVNPAAHVVGVAYLPGDTEFHAYSWTPERGMVDIGLSGYSAAFDVNASGRVVGGNGSRHAFSWTEAGGMTDLGTLGGVFSEARAVNASGQIAGQSSLANDAISHAFSWTQAGGMVDLGSLGGTFSRSFAVNVNGQVVGESALAGDAVNHAFSWTQAGGMVDIAALGGTGSNRAVAVNDNGQVVGYASVFSGSVHAFSWTEAGVVDLGTLGGNDSVAMDVNANGQVVGYSNYVAGNPARHAFLWTAAGGMIDLGTLGGSHSQAFAVNAHGAVVGESTLSDGSNHAFFWTQAGGMIDLGTLGGTFSGATAINDQCHIVGFSLLPDGTSRHATLWYVKSCDTSTASDAK